MVEVSDFNVVVWLPCRLVVVSSDVEVTVTTSSVLSAAVVELVAVSSLAVCICFDPKIRPNIPSLYFKVYRCSRRGNSQT